MHKKRSRINILALKGGSKYIQMARGQALEIVSPINKNSYIDIVLSKRKIAVYIKKKRTKARNGVSVGPH